MPDSAGFYTLPGEQKALIVPKEGVKVSADPDEDTSNTRYHRLLDRLASAYYNFWREGVSQVFRFQAGGAPWNVLLGGEEATRGTRTKRQFNRLNIGIQKWQIQKKAARREERLGRPLDPAIPREANLIEQRDIADQFFIDNPDIVIADTA